MPILILGGGGMARPIGTSTVVAPNVAWPTFKKFLSDLQGRIPDRVDSSLTGSLSGSSASQLRGALRFLGLTNESSATTPVFEQLALSIGSDRWPHELAQVIRGSYHGIVGDLDFSKATQAQLDEAFRTKGNVSGETVGKATRFYVAAATEAGLPLSPFFTGAPTPSGEKPKTKKKSNGRRQKTDTPHIHGEGMSTPKPPQGSQEYSLPLPGKPPIRLWLPDELTAQEWDAVNKYLSAILNLASLKVEA